MTRDCDCFGYDALDAFSGDGGVDAVWGAGAGVDAGGVMQGAASLVGAVGGLVQTGRTTETKLDIKSADVNRNFGKEIAAIKRILQEIATAQAALRKNPKRLDAPIIKKVIEAAKHTRPRGVSYAAAQTGNLDGWRALALRSFQHAVTFDGFRDALAAAGVSIYRLDVVFDPANIKLVFPGDPDGKRGVVPLTYRSGLLTQMMNFVEQEMLPESYRPPLWVHGLTPEQQGRVPAGIGPTVQAIRAFVDGEVSQEDVEAEVGEVAVAGIGYGALESDAVWAFFGYAGAFLPEAAWGKAPAKGKEPTKKEKDGLAVLSTLLTGGIAAAAIDAAAKKKGAGKKRKKGDKSVKRPSDKAVEKLKADPKQGLVLPEEKKDTGKTVAIVAGVATVVGVIVNVLRR